jgi:predicted ABC-type ATPase
VRQRVALGGHPVPEDRIVARYERSLALLPDALALCDRAVLFDNSYADRLYGPAAFAPVAEFRRDRRPFAWTNRRGGPLVLAQLPRWAQGVLKAVRGRPSG